MSLSEHEQMAILELLADALSAPHSMEEGLEQIMQLACRLMETEQAAFLRIDEERQAFVVMAATGLNSENIKIGQVLDLPDRLHSVLWRQTNMHQINWIESGIENLVFPIVVMPIYFKGQRLGHLITGASKDSNKTKDPMRRKMLGLLGPFTSLIIENARAADLLNQHFATNSRELMESMGQKKEPGNNEVVDKLMADTVSNPGKVIRLLTESFYRELKTAGFVDSDIAIASSHLLACIMGRQE